MKTAISLPDDLFEAADELASRLGLPRSQLYARALEEFLAKHAGSRVTERLDEVYRDGCGRIDPVVRRAQRRTLDTHSW